MSPPTTRSLTQVLRAAATELAELAAVADHLECLTPTTGLTLDPGVAERFQFADLLTQRLAGLTWLFDSLACSAPEGVNLELGEALGGLTLSDQARRFGGASPFPPPPAEASGDVFLFD